MSIGDNEVVVDFKDTVPIPDAVLEAKVEKLLGLVKK